MAAARMIIEVLKKSSGPLTAQEVAKKAGRPANNISSAFTLLYKNGAISRARNADGKYVYSFVKEATKGYTVYDRPAKGKPAYDSGPTAFRVIPVKKRQVNGVDNAALSKDLIVTAHKLLATAVQLLGGGE